MSCEQTAEGAVVLLSARRSRAWFVSRLLQHNKHLTWWQTAGLYLTLLKFKRNKITAKPLNVCNHIQVLWPPVWARITVKSERYTVHVSGYLIFVLLSSLSMSPCSCDSLLTFSNAVTCVEITESWQAMQWRVLQMGPEQTSPLGSGGTPMSVCREFN